MTREEAIDLLEDIKFTSSDHLRDVEALEMAIEALAKMESIQEVIDMPFVWEQDDRRRYSKVVDIVRKDLAQEDE